MAETRSRSASPAKDEPKPKKQKTGGFKWKEKRYQPEGETGSNAAVRNEPLHRGYRDRLPRRDSYRARDRSPPRSDIAVFAGGDSDGDRDSYRPSYRAREGDRSSKTDRPERPERPITPVWEKFGKRSKDDRLQDSTTIDKPKKEKKVKKSTAPSEPMIIVNINDRLGTKAAIPCLASDSIKAFKAVVAAHIGRQPHEIMLKRQGERPFKDALTLEDYGVSNGVQLDLELDTGD